jgi:outer membrane murein-binding lipoprotein Lpp
MTVIIYSTRANTSEQRRDREIPKALKNLSQAADGQCGYPCNPRVDLVKLRLRSTHMAAKCGWRGAVRTYQTRISRGFTQMNKAIIVKLAAAAAVFALAGCTDIKPLTAEVDALKTQVGTLQSDLAAHKADRSAENAAAKAGTDAASAAAAAASAQSTANQALAAAQAAQSGVDATNEKIDRMFKKSVSK